MTYIIITWLALAAIAVSKWIGHYRQRQVINELEQLGFLTGYRPMNNKQRLEQWARKYAPMQIIERGMNFDNSRFLKWLSIDERKS